MHGKYGDREAAVQAVALQDDMDGRSRRRAGAAWRKLIDSRRPAPPAGHATRQHYDTALLRFERGNTAGPGGVVVPMPAPPLTAEGLRAEDMNADGTPKPHVLEPSKAEIVEAAAARLASTDSAASGDALVGLYMSEVWHTEAPPVPGVYAIDYANERSPSKSRWCAWWDGCAWHGIASKQDERAVELARKNGLDSIAVVWLRLIEADTPAPDAQESAKPRVSRWDGLMGWSIDGKLYHCDADGWISHTPTADAECPIPANTEAEVRFRDGDVHESLPNEAWRWNHEGTMGDIVAWRPVTQA